MDNDPQDIFCAPVLDKYLLYAPRHQMAALVNRTAVRAIRAGIEAGAPIEKNLSQLVESLRVPVRPTPHVRNGPVDDPFFLGLIPTRGCNMHCQYCDFPAPKQTSPRMDLNVARAAIDAYAALIASAGKHTLKVEFFGGEPFAAWEVVFFAVEYARWKASELGLQPHFDVITNGFLSARRCQWVGDHFDGVIVSLDGPADLHDRQRPAREGKPTHAVVARSVRMLSEGPAELSLRACVTQEGVERMPEIAEYFAREFRPAVVCMENLSPSESSQFAGLHAPDPLAFARGYVAAARILARCGIEASLSTAPMNTLQSSFCPVGKDALIVSPGGSVDACYWLEEEWQKAGLDLHLGYLAGDSFHLDPAAVQRARDLTMVKKSGCAGCLCQVHCAGGCHARRIKQPDGRHNDEVCIHTRIITIASILGGLGQESLVDAWLADTEALRSTALSPDDRLIRQEWAQ